MSNLTEKVFMIDLAEDFCPTPLGRTRQQGRYSGEAFREDHLRPALEAGYKIVVNLDGASGLSTGFLDEAFAGLVRDRTLTEQGFHARIAFVSAKDPLVIEEIHIFAKRASHQLAQI